MIAETYHEHDHHEGRVVTDTEQSPVIDSDEEPSPETSEALLAPPAGISVQYSRSSTRIPQILAALAGKSLQSKGQLS